MVGLEKLDKAYTSGTLICEEAQDGKESIKIDAERLGINDPLTHLYNYLENGEDAIVSIQEDLETDIAERLPKTPFVNFVQFETSGNDFRSVKDKVSMAMMVKNNLRIITAELPKNPGLVNEFIRAKIEASEVIKLSEWFKRAPVNGYIIFESLPIGDQKIAVSRVYRKIDENMMEGCFVSLYNPTIESFNNFRRRINESVDICDSELEILQNHYEFFDSRIQSPDDFINFYVNTYDEVLYEKTGDKYRFGLEDDNTKAINDGLKKVRGKTTLTRAYIDLIRCLANSGGIADSDVVKLSRQLDFGCSLTPKQPISSDLARQMMRNVIIGITSAIDKIDEDTLIDMESASINNSDSYAVISHYAEHAHSSGEVYASNNCPEYSGQKETEGITESQAMESAFIGMERLDDFGWPHMGVCRIKGCPCNGKISIVGGCEICVHCHKLFAQGKNPEKIYADELRIRHNENSQNSGSAIMDNIYDKTYDDTRSKEKPSRSNNMLPKNKKNTVVRGTTKKKNNGNHLSSRDIYYIREAARAA